MTESTLSNFDSVWESGVSFYLVIKNPRFFPRHHPIDLSIHLNRRSSVKDTEESSGSFWDSCS